MNIDNFEKVVEEQINKCREILIVKAREYATEDRLHNFKIAGVMEGIGPIKALAGMMAKHTVSIYDMCGSGGAYGVDVWSEKITDHIHYLLLLGALVEDEMGCQISQIAGQINGSDQP
jgi:hypothetical protein